MQHRTKILTFDVIHYDGTNADEVNQFIQESVPGEVEWLTSSPPIPIVPTPQGSSPCRPGERIIRLADGSLYPCSPKILTALSEPV